MFFNTLEQFIGDAVLKLCVDDKSTDAANHHGYNCRFHRYNKADSVRCFDYLLTPETSLSASKRNLHFAFIGDSRIRQHFINFLKV